MNQKFSRLFHRSGIPVLHLGYEEIALLPELSLRLFCDWLGLDFTPQMLGPGLNSQCNILLGNRVRQYGGRNQLISYDGSWLINNALGISTCLLSSSLPR